MLGPPVRRDSFSDRDYEMKRGLLGTNPGLDMRNQTSAELPHLSRVPAQMPASSIHAQGGWLVDDDNNRGPPSNRPSGFVQPPDIIKSEKLVHQNPFSPATPSSTPSGLLSQKSDVKREEVCSEFFEIHFGITCWF